MIYQINNKYYIRVAPMKYTEIDFELKNNKVVIKTTNNKLEVNGRMTVKEINFQSVKESIKENLQCTQSTDNSETINSKYRKRR